MPKIRDRWFRFLVILIPFLLVLYVNNALVNTTQVKVMRSLISLGAAIMICEGSRYLIYKSHQWFAGRYRMLYLFLIGVAWTTFFIALSAVLKKYVVTGSWDLTEMKDTNIVMNDKKLVIGLFGYSLMNAVINFSILLILFEILYHRAQFRYAKEEKEKLEKEKLKAEILQLKGIVNPHFLFNNLNSLSSLIGENPTQAQEFLDELTKVFRYLLRNNQTELTPLSEELKFIQTYYHLLQTRYGQAIKMDLQIDTAYDDLLIPPLTLQLLVENAVKHNRLQKDDPLRIELIAAPDKKLVVRNNVSRREGKVESTGIGLQNINARYKMLSQPGVIIEQNEETFTVVIPLIDNVQI